MNQTDPTAETGPARKGSTERCANPNCGHTKRDHSGRADHRERHGALVAGDPWCHACGSECRYEPPAAASAVVSPPTDRAVLRDRIAALFRCPPGEERLGDATPGEIADAVLAVLPEPTDRAAGLLEAADRMSRKAAKLTEGLNDLAIFVGKARAAEAEILNREADELRRLAAEAQQPDCDHDSQVIDHEGAQYWVCLKCGTNLGRVEAEQQPAAADGEETRS